VPIAGLCWLLVWTALAFAQADINTAGSDPGRRNLLDLYRHRARPSGSRVLIHLHGGGYYRGRKNSQSLPLLYRLASQGWVCVSANYRLRPAAQHPDYLIGLKKVIAWVGAYGHEYGADPGMLFVSGSSAGARTWRRWPRSPPTIPPSSPASRMPTPRSPPPSG
jgi:acetyl esterase/lipase